ncbi:dihydrofolate reductase [Streptococcus massiliensis]|uniref:Dihydrofolate reductase n=1 Tax=Streptococcus massiliensis TaxID=313439 RepID=A0A380KXV2_9STRE|nr:dihydrofolate reductase [Streptococcus massiliensis]SUN76109.1 dihydrofolate reductase [Streptococcus massiliensis]
MSKKIVAIWAQDEAGLIGKDNRMPWYLPAELQHFKETTMGQAILMGRVTFDGMKRRVLSGRTTLVLTADKHYQIEDERVLVFHDVQSVLRWYEKQDKTLFIIGGAQILAAFEPYIEEIVQTQVHATLEGDTYFPERFDLSKFALLKEDFHAKDEKNPYDFTVKLLRKEA